MATYTNLLAIDFFHKT